MVEILYGAPQWEIPQYWFISCSIVSRYSTTMTNEMFPSLAPQLQEKQWWIFSMVFINGRFPKPGFFLAQLCLNTLVRMNIGKNVSFASSSIASKTMVEMLYGAPQWNIPQAFFLSCSIVSTYSTAMTKLMFPLLTPQLQAKQSWRCSIVFLNGKFPKIVLFLVFLAQLCLHTPPQ